MTDTKPSTTGLADAKNAQTLWRWTRGHRGRYAAAIAAMIAGILLLYLSPLIIRAAIDGLIDRKPVGQFQSIVDFILKLAGNQVPTALAIAGGMVLLVTLVSGVFTFIRGRWAALASEGIARGLRDRLFAHLQHVPVSYHDAAQTGDLVQRCTSDVDTIRAFYSTQVIEIGRATVLFLTATPVLIYLDWKMAIVSVAVMPVIVTFSAGFFKRVQKAFKLSDEAEGKLTTTLQENLTGIRVVRAFARQAFEIERFDEKNQNHRKLSYQLYVLMALYWSLSDVLIFVQMAAVLFVGAWRASHGTMSVGTLVAFLQVEGMVVWPIRQLGRILTETGKAVVSLGRVQEILDQPGETSPEAIAGETRGEIELRNVSFNHGGKAVLQDISLKIPAGQTLAILGPSGAGKSTLVNLLLRFYDPDTGSILLDGKPIAELSRKSVRAQFAVVMQEPFLFSRTLRQNILLGEPGASEDDAIQASMAAAIHDSIESFDKKYETLIGERGVTLSGGQRQRVAIARALLRDAPVLVFDDALSAVDTRTEADILDALRRRRGQRTTILIAHRISTLAQADRIVVLEDGRITQDGAHDQLIAERGLYQRLWEIQGALEDDLKSELVSVGEDMADEQQQDDENYNPRLNLALWRTVLGFARPYRMYLIALSLIGVVCAACDATLPWVTGRFVDEITHHGRSAALGRYELIYLLVVMSLSCAIFGFIMVAGRITTGVSYDIRKAAFDKLQRLSFSYYDRKAVGWLMARLTSDVGSLSRVLGWALLDLVYGSIVLTSIAVVMLSLNWKLGLIVLAIFPVLVAVSRFFQVRLLKTSRLQRKANSHTTAAFNEGIVGVRTSKSFVREEQNLKDFQDLTTTMYRHAMANAIYSALFLPCVLSICSVGVGLALWRGGIDVTGGVISLGTLVMFLQYAGFIQNPAQELANTLTLVQGAQASAERLASLLDEPIEISDAADVDANGSLASITSIEFRDVNFAYKQGQPVLQDFNLRVEAGQSIALVGPTGGGKSTIVSLLCRFYEPTAGEILINGVDYRKLPLLGLQSRLGMVLQQPHLFSGTIRENIRYGRLNATDADIEQAARTVNAHEFILAMKDGYDAAVGEGGNQLSTGQKQLIALARAMIANPELFVMDEATSSVDTHTEQAIQSAVERVLAHRISFVIAHRLSTIRSASRILVIDGGQIVESGTHAELLQQRGRYFELYTNQFRSERESRMLEVASGR